MSQSTARTLAALELLQARQRVTGAELAERLQVDIRTARRYVVRLMTMGVPVVAERGRDGAYRLAAAYKLPPMMFSDEEALALAVGLVAARDLGLGQTRIAVDSTLVKLERVMPDALKARMRAVGRAIRLEPLSPDTVLHHGALALLSEAVEKQQRVRMTYQPEGELATERLLDPWGLAFYLRHWYVVGFCHLRGGQRAFRLDRISALDWVAASFAPPPGFDALASLRHSVTTLKRKYVAEVVLHADLPQAQAAVFAELGTLEALNTSAAAPDARVLLRSQVHDLHWLARQLAQLPFRFEVRKPAALNQALLKLAQDLRDNAQRKPET